MSVSDQVTADDLPRSNAILVADELVPPGGPTIRCPAAPLLVGDLHRRGLSSVVGGLRLDADPVRAIPGDPHGRAVPDRPSGADRYLGAGRAGSVRAASFGTRPGDVAALAVVFDAEDPVGLGLAYGTAGPAERRAARAVLRSWSAVAGPRTLLLAAPRSFCAGVERAIEIVERALARWGGPIYVRRQIVHNTHVVADLEARGAVFVDELDAVPEGATVIFSAHGVAPAVRDQARERRLRVVDATCPLVTKVHSEARRFAARGDTVVLIGHAGHEEVEGTLGEAPGRIVMVESADDVGTLRVADPSRVSYLMQTTLAVDETGAVVDALRERFPALRGPGSDDICYATTNRQQALSAITDEAELVLVVGSANSSNSRRLAELARRHDTPAHLIDGPGDIRAEWLACVRTVGLTAGASAPPAQVAAVADALAGLGPVTVRERETTREDIRFGLPPEVRRP